MKIAAFVGLCFVANGIIDFTVMFFTTPGAKSLLVGTSLLSATVGCVIMLAAIACMLFARKLAWLAGQHNPAGSSRGYPILRA